MTSEENCQCHYGYACDVSHDPDACPCRRCGGDNARFWLAVRPDLPRQCRDNVDGSLYAASRTLDKKNERECSDPEPPTAARKALETAALQTVELWARVLRVNVRFNGDPRGFAFTYHVPGQPEISNSFGGPGCGWGWVK